jgi:hypothetical protein
MKKDVSMNTDCVHLVRVTTDDRKHQLWAAATPRDEAVDRVLDAIPEGWTARLLDDPMQPSQQAVMRISAGEVRALM